QRVLRGGVVVLRLRAAARALARLARQRPAQGALDRPHLRQPTGQLLALAVLAQPARFLRRPRQLPRRLAVLALSRALLALGQLLLLLARPEVAALAAQPLLLLLLLQLPAQALQLVLGAPEVAARQGVGGVAGRALFFLLAVLPPQPLDLLHRLLEGVEAVGL